MQERILKLEGLKVGGSSPELKASSQISQFLMKQNPSYSQDWL